MEYTCKILVMDDEAALRQLLNRMLNHFGCDVELASNGEEAVEAYRNAFKSDDPFDIVIVDLTVAEGMGGIETVEQIRKFDKNVKVIIASGHLTDSIMDEIESGKFNGSLPKPFKMDELEAVLTKVLNS